MSGIFTSLNITVQTQLGHEGYLPTLRADLNFSVYFVATTRGGGFNFFIDHLLSVIWFKWSDLHHCSSIDVCVIDKIFLQTNDNCSEPQKNTCILDLLGPLFLWLHNSLGEVAQLIHLSSFARCLAADSFQV